MITYNFTHTPSRIDHKPVEMTAVSENHLITLVSKGISIVSVPKDIKALKKCLFMLYIQGQRDSRDSSDVVVSTYGLGDTIQRLENVWNKHQSERLFNVPLFDGTAMLVLQNT